MSFLIHKDGIMSTIRSTWKALVLCFFLVSGFVMVWFAPHSMASGREIYVSGAFSYPRDGSAEHPYRSITEALNLASEGDTIYVFAGTYNETVTINKRVSLIGGIDNEPSIIYSRFSHYYNVDITSDFVTLENFTLLDTERFITSQRGALVHVGADNVVVQKNNLSSCDLWGIYLDSSNDDTISGNLINGTKGAYVSGSNNNVFSNNNISNSSDAGIKISSSTKNIIYDNYFKKNSFGISSIDSSYSNITRNTFVQNKYHGMYLFGDRDDVIRANSIRNNTESGINIESYNCLIADNRIDGNQVGITVQQSGCEVRNNTLINQGGIGLSATRGSSNNIISLNHFQKNMVNAKEQGHNQWDAGGKGNYWSDYYQIDRNLDGIGDVPYLIDSGGVDHYPLGVFLQPPRKPLNPSPADDAENVGLKITLTVKVFDNDSTILTVYFYNAVDDIYLGRAVNAISGTNASFSMRLPFDTTFAWYAIANDSQLENRSDIWFFTTRQRPPENKKPVANPGNHYSASINQPVTFNGSSSYDPDGSIIFYRWNFGDGSSEILDKTPVHTYSDPGTFRVTLTVVDNDGRSAMANTTVVVSGVIYKNNPPVARFFTSPSPAKSNQLITFDAGQSNDTDGRVVGYRWDFDGDGVFDTNWTSSPLMTHSYARQGSYLVRLEVKDNANATGVFSSGLTVQPVQKKSPGFEMLLVVLALAVLLIKYRKRK
jgi:parallel beta-helix repeat protein